MNKINYYRQSTDEISSLAKENRHPSLLLHACCAPCASFPLEFLAETFDLTIFYNNSNIYPLSEYERRLAELKRYLEWFNQEYKAEVKLIVTPYRNEEYTKMLETQKELPEGRGRCFRCYALRMREAFDYADRHHFDYFTTVMTISRQKNSQKLNEIGKSLSRLYPNTKYFYSDFKKNRGIDRALELAKKHQLYRQEYCGCLYSYLKRQAEMTETNTDEGAAQ